MSDRHWYREILNNIECFLLDIKQFLKGQCKRRDLRQVWLKIDRILSITCKEKSKRVTGLRRIQQTNVLKFTFTWRKTGEFIKLFAIGLLFLLKIHL